MKGNLTATKLRLILVVSLFVIASAEAVIFTFAYGQLKQTATDVSHVVVDASASENNLTTLEKIEKILASEKNVIDRASSIVADSQSYQYQDQIITDLNNYANKNSVTITNVDFSASQTATAAPGQAAAPAPATAAPAGLKSTSVTVTLKTPVDYNNLLKFIEAVEQNLTKMQISKVGLSKGASTGNDVTSDALTIEVYIR